MLSGLALWAEKTDGVPQWNGCNTGAAGILINCDILYISGASASYKYFGYMYLLYVCVRGCMHTLTIVQTCESPSVTWVLRIKLRL